MTTSTNVEMLIDTTVNTAFEKFYNKLQNQQQSTILKALKTNKVREKEKKEKIYYKNTRLLLRHYPEFEAHVRGSITCKKELLESEYYNEMDTEKVNIENLLLANVDEDVYISSIQRTKSRTQLLLNNIDSQLAQLKKICIKKGNVYKYDMLIDSYVNGYTQELIAEKYGCHKTQVSMWTNEMANALSRLLFGVDSMEEFM